MKKLSIISGLIATLASILLMNCSIYIPGDFDYGRDHYKIILDISPDDSSVFLKGRFIGLAYEFSTFRSGLKFRSLDRELIIKKKGFIEKVIIPSDYVQGHSSTIFIKSSLSMDTSTENIKFGNIKQTKKDPGYQAKKVKIQDPEESEKSLSTPKEKKLIKGTITFSHSDSSIFIDDEFFGISPGNKTINNLHLKSGTHKITVFKPGYKVFTKTFDIQSESFTIKVILKK